MKSKISFDHAYTVDHNHRFLDTLSRLGFTISEKVVSHPGSVCRFIHFESSPYLEFIHNPKRNFPGISFKYDGELKKLFHHYQRKKYSCNFLHRNYNWEENDSDDLPGWNFLDFNQRGFNTFYPWFTEYESFPNRQRQPVLQTHRNKVSGVIGHEFILNSAGFDFFHKIFGSKIKSRLLLNQDMIFYFKEGKRNYHSKIILKSQSFPQTVKFMKKQTLSKFEGRDSVLIENMSDNQRMWDLLIIDA